PRTIPRRGSVSFLDRFPGAWRRSVRTCPLGFGRHSQEMEMSKPRSLSAALFSLAGGSVLLSMVAIGAASAETIEVSIPWPDSNFHTKNLKAFAELAKERTEGRVEFIVNS